VYGVIVLLNFAVARLAPSSGRRSVQKSDEWNVFDIVGGAQKKAPTERRGSVDLCH
jgi:hypothetical protein